MLLLFKLRIKLCYLFYIILVRCDLTCLNGGILNTNSCVCVCPSGFSGYNCIQSPSGNCNLTCLNGGTLNSDSCQCACASNFTGYNCENSILLFTLALV